MKKIYQYQKNHSEIIVYGIAIMCGTLLSSSLSFHIGLLQNLSFWNKFIYISFMTIPLSWLIAILIQFSYITRTNKKIFVSSIAAITLSFVFFKYLYTPIPVNRLHSFSLHVPEQNNPSLIVTINDIYIMSLIQADIPFDSLNFNGKVKYYSDQFYRLYQNASIYLTKQFAGTIYVFMESSTCPAFVQLIADEKSYSFELCTFNKTEPIILNTSDSGIIPYKWNLFQEIFVTIDFLICLLLFFLITMFFLRLFTEHISAWRTNYPKLFTLSQCFFFFESIFLLGFSTYLIIRHNISDIIIFLPCILFLLFHQLLLHRFFYHRRQQFFSIWLIVFLIVGTWINQFLPTTYYFNKLYVQFNPINFDKTKSLNSVLISVYSDSSLNYVLLYGGSDLLYGCELITTPDIYSEMIEDFEILKRPLGDNFLLTPANLENLSSSEFDCLLKLQHTEWKLSDDKRIIFLDKEYRLETEPVVLHKFQEDYILFPLSLIKRSGICNEQ